LGDVDRDKLLAWGSPKYEHFRVVKLVDHCEVGGLFKGPPPILRRLQSTLANFLTRASIARRGTYESKWVVIVPAARARERLGLNEEVRLKREQVVRVRAMAKADRARERAEEIERQKVKACWMFARLVRTRERTGYLVLAADVMKRHAAQRAEVAAEVAARKAVADEEWRARRARIAVEEEVRARRGWREIEA
jgi:hypothetical protein